MKNLRPFFFLVLLSLALAACGAQPSPTPQATNTPEPPTATPRPTATLTPTALPGRVALVIPSDYDPAEGQALQTAVQELAAQNGLLLDVVSEFQSSALTEQVKVVIFPVSPADLASLVSSAPQTQFLVYSTVDLPVADNLSVIRQCPERKAFLAGYIAELAAVDWRGGGILPSTDASVLSLEQAFLNGGKFYCGRCAPRYAPVVYFPVSTNLIAGSDLNAVKAAFDTLNANILEIVYVHPSLSSPELWQYLAGKKLALIGETTPPEDVRSNWVATIAEDKVTPLQELFPLLAGGQGGQVKDAPIILTDVNEERFSVGKQRLAQETIQMMEEGLLLPLQNE